MLALLLAPLVDLLGRYHLPRFLGALLSVGLLLAIITLILDAAWSPALSWVDNAPTIMQKVERKIRPLQRMVERVDTLTTRATTLTTVAANPAAASSSPSTVDTDRHSALGIGRTLLIDLATVSIPAVFLLAGGGRTLRKLESDLAAQGQTLQYMRIVKTVRSELSRYYSTLALINIGLVLVTTAIMALWGLPIPWLWGITAGVLNFIPYVGPTNTLIVVTVVAWVSVDGCRTGRRWQLSADDDY